MRFSLVLFGWKKKHRKLTDKELYQISIVVMGFQHPEFQAEDQAARKFQEQSLTDD